jgi:tRNA(Ile)-lysidine synthase
VSFTPADLRQALQRCPPVSRYWIAFSGGLDSSALLHAMATLRSGWSGMQLAALHIDHGLSPSCGLWSRHCAELCAALGVSFRMLRVQVQRGAGTGPEAAARLARHQAFLSVLAPGEGLVTAHHQDDQAETVLLQLLRGSGTAGLAAMPRCARFGQGWLLRPLLGYQREALRAYAEQAGLAWIEDESNVDIGLDRNYLRHRVLPLIRERWPGHARAFARTACHMAEALGLAQALAEIDLARIRGPRADTLSVRGLLELQRERQHNVVRFWLGELALPLPPAARLESVLATLLTAAVDRNPLVAWPGAELRRYRGLLYAMPPLPPAACGAALAWDMDRALTLPCGTLRAVPGKGEGLRAADCERLAVSVRFRQGGERCQLAVGSRTRTLKQLLQEHGVPPWLRERIPLIYLGEALAAVADRWTCQPFAATGDERAVRLVWEPSHPGCGAP